MEKPHNWSIWSSFDTVKYDIANGGLEIDFAVIGFFLLSPQRYKSSAFVAVDIKTSLKITILILTI